MADTLVDTSVILDVADARSVWAEWAGRRLADAADEGMLFINQIIYSELVAGYATREELEAAVGTQRFQREGVPWDAAFLAGVAHLAYRRRGGPRTSPLPDFFIGAHAAVRGYRLLTRDRGYYRAYFEGVDLVTPETHP